MQLSKPTRSGGAPAQTEGAVPVARTDRTERADRASRPAVVDIQDVEVTLGATTALADVSTTIRAGEAVALLGANGSGKSTMLRAILKLVPHKGSVSLFGSPQHRFRDWHRIGYVPQYADPALQRATVREVVSTGRLAHRRPFTIPGRAERRIVNDLIEQVGLAGREGWELGQLSGGQQQRARIARALATGPELLALDEPLAGLDMASQEGLASLLRQFKSQGMAMLVVLHEMGPLGGLMDRALVLDHGHLVHDGPPVAEGSVATLSTALPVHAHCDHPDHHHGHGDHAHHANEHHGHHEQGHGDHEPEPRLPGLVEGFGDS
nr:metal transport system ABC transporter, ATPase component [uncultured bacterium]